MVHKHSHKNYLKLWDRGVIPGEFGHNFLCMTLESAVYDDLLRQFNEECLEQTGHDPLSIYVRFVDEHANVSAQYLADLDDHLNIADRPAISTADRYSVYYWCIDCFDPHDWLCASTGSGHNGSTCLFLLKSTSQLIQLKLRLADSILHR